MVVYTLPSNAKTLLGISSLHDNHAIRTVSTVVHITLSFSCNVNIVKWLAIFSSDFFSPAMRLLLFVASVLTISFGLPCCRGYTFDI